MSFDIKAVFEKSPLINKASQVLKIEPFEIWWIKRRFLVSVKCKNCGKITKYTVYQDYYDNAKEITKDIQKQIDKFPIKLNIKGFIYYLGKCQKCGKSIYLLDFLKELESCENKS